MDENKIQNGETEKLKDDVYRSNNFTPGFLKADKIELAI